MKKIGFLISLITLMFLSGCLSEKTKEKLSEVPGGGIGDTIVNYIFTTTNLPVEEELEKNSVLGTYYSFRTPLTVAFTKTAFDETTSKETAIKKDVFPKISLIASSKDIKIEDVKNTSIAELITDKVIKETLIGNGEIEFKSVSLKGIYKAYEILNEKNEKFFVSLALLPKVIKIDNVDKSMWYLVTNVSTGNEKSDVLIFETLLRSLNMSKQNIEDVITGNEKDLLEQDLFIKLNTAVTKEEIRIALDDIYTYIEKYYQTESGITAGMTQEQKLVKIWEYANELKPKVEFNTYQMVRNKVSTLGNYVLKDLEGALAKLQIVMAKLDSSNLSYSLISAETENTEKIMKEYEKIKQEEMYVQKKDGRIFTVQDILSGASFGWATKPLYAVGIECLTTAKLVQLEDEFGNSQGEERNKQINEVLRWYNITNRNKTILDKMYLEQLDPLKPLNLNESIIRDYVDKISINELYDLYDDNETPDDLTDDTGAYSFVAFYNRLENEGKTESQILALQKSLLLVLEKSMKTSGKVIIAQVENYYTTRVGYYYMEKQWGQVASESDFKNIQNSFETYMEKIKMFNNDIYSTLPDDEKINWESVKKAIEESLSMDKNIINLKKYVAYYDDIIQ